MCELYLRKALVRGLHACRARLLISNQLDDMSSAPISDVISALRQDLQQLLSSYDNPMTFPSSRSQALSMATTHSSQRVSGHSSRRPPPTSAAAGQGSQLGPYSTASQSNYAERSKQMRLFQPRTDSARVRTNAADASWSTGRRPEDRGWPTQPLGLGQSQAAPGFSNRARDLDSGLTGAAAAPQQGATLNRIPSNDSDAGKIRLSSRRSHSIGFAD